VLNSTFTTMHLSPDVPPVMTNFHHMGSTRRHVDPGRGVVDAELRVH
jgi:choline dehydrogenase-like flavoprotein